MKISVAHITIRQARRWLRSAALMLSDLLRGATCGVSFDDEQLWRVSNALREARVDHEIVIYHALHGFAVPDNPPYDESAA